MGQIVSLKKSKDHVSIVNIFPKNEIHSLRECIGPKSATICNSLNQQRHAFRNELQLESSRRDSKSSPAKWLPAGDSKLAKLRIIVQPFFPNNNNMKKIKLRISELTNPELLSSEAMKGLRGGGTCYTGTCYVEDKSGTCVSTVGDLCACKTGEGEYGAVLACYI